MISCDFTFDKKNILCAYITQDKYFTISVFDEDMNIIKTKIFERSPGFQKDYFIKIVYFKSNSNFITMNSEDKLISRLRYFKYINGEIINQLNSITSNNDEYLDISRTQNSGNSYEIDMIPFGNDTIIKVYSFANDIIITIFQFYDFDSLLFIKIYKMEGLSLFGYSNFINPRLALFRNSIVVCITTLFDYNRRSGFFFIGYPTSKDVELTSNRIIIKDLISIKNNLFILDLKFKILKIPKDFIFLSKINNQEIKENENLNEDDELILRQYRIREGPYILKYEGIAIGDDQSYSIGIVYPLNRNKPAPSEILINGEEGEITIDLNECLEGYYHLDYDNNLCTNIKPNGYYLDNETKTFKACCDSCSECFGPQINKTHMQCISCKKGFNMTEDTDSCYNYLPSQYYLDNDTFRRCHSRCYRCLGPPLSNDTMNCLSCISVDYFFRRDTSNCILSSDFNQRKHIDLSTESSWAFIFFNIIFVLSIGITIYISCSCCCFKSVHNENNENNKEENIKEKDGINKYDKISKDINEQIDKDFPSTELQNKIIISNDEA